MSGWSKFTVLLLGCVGVALLLARPLGLYIAAVMEGPGTRLPQFLARAEAALYRLAGVDPTVEMGWLPYTVALLLFNVVGALLLYALSRLQAHLPLNPQG